MLQPLVTTPINVVQGRITHHVRNKLGLNNIINETNRKIRSDHAHHAIDAIVIALTQLSYLQALRTHYKKKERLELETKDDKTERKSALPFYEGLRDKVKEAIDQLIITRHSSDNRLISHRKVKTEKNGKIYTNLSIAARGELHEEKIYGLRNPISMKEEENKKNIDSQGLHIRVPITEITTHKKAQKIVDPVIRKKVIAHIEAHTDKEKVRYYDTAGKPLLHLKNKKGASVPIKHIRIRKNSSQRIKRNPQSEVNRYVLNSGNHHVLLYHLTAPTKRKEIGTLCTTFKEAVERRRKKQHVFQLPPEATQPIAYFRKGDYFLLGIEDSQNIDWNDREKLSHHLYRVQKIGMGSIWFIHHRVAALIGAKGEKLQIGRHAKAISPKVEGVRGRVFCKAPSKLHKEEPVIPVHISLLGEISPRPYKFPKQ